MKKLLNIMIIALCFAECSAQKALPGWKIVWSDEFNYNGLPDSSKWGNEVGFIRNNELQYYTKRRIENSRVYDGNLLIIGRKQAYDKASFMYVVYLTSHNLFGKSCEFVPANCLVIYLF